MHGFKAKAFHDRCDKKGPTICFVLTEHGKVCGGYVSIDWESLNGVDKADANAFIFSLTHNTKHHQYRNQEYASRHDKNYIWI